MRKLYYTLLLLLSGHLWAQFPQNGGFEDSTMVTGGYIPSNWSVDGFGFGYSNDANSGSKAASVWNWYYYAKGWIVNGNTQTVFDGGGMAVGANPLTLAGMYKYEYGENQGAADSAVVQVLITNAADDTLAWHELHLGPASNYTGFQIPISYRLPGQTADSVILRFISSINGFCANSSNGTCLYFTVDDIEMSFLTGTTTVMDFEPRPSLAPNPSQSGFAIHDDGADIYPCTIEIHDLLGRVVLMEGIEAPTTAFLGADLPQGQYLWRIQSRNGKAYSGKHHVVKP